MQEPMRDRAVPRRVMDLMAHIQQLIKDDSLQPGDRLPTERELAKQLKISRGSVRIGIGYLTGMGVMEVRRGVGTFLADGAGRWGESSFQMLGALHGAQLQQMVETRLILEVAAAALAAERATEGHLRMLAEEVAEMYSAVSCAKQFTTHEMRFHRALAESSCNAVLAASMDTIATAAFTEGHRAAESEVERRRAADVHREIYKAIRHRRPEDARRWMGVLLSQRGAAFTVKLDIAM